MKLAIAVGFLAVALIITNVVNYLQQRTMDDLRKDISRTSYIQTYCAGEASYSLCVDTQLERWWNK